MAQLSRAFDRVVCRLNVWILALHVVGVLQYKQAAEAAADDIPVESGKQILLNWIIAAVGLGGVAAVGALLPKLL